MTLEVIIIIFGIIVLCLIVELIFNKLNMPIFSSTISGKYKKLYAITRPGHLDDDCIEWKYNEIAKNSKNKKFEAVYGEFRSIKTLTRALENDFVVELIIGKKVLNQMSKDNLKMLLNKYPDKFHVHQLNYRPDRHATKIGNSLFIEEEHEIENNYPGAIVYDSPSGEMLGEFNNHFLSLILESTPVTLDKVDSIKTYR